MRIKCYIVCLLSISDVPAERGAEVFDLNGKTALVTGAARGIGKRVAEVLAAHGARVIRSDRAPQDATPDVCMIRHDVTVPEDWESVLAFVRSGFGRLDILVNNAGVILNKPFKSTTIDEFRALYRVNVESVWTGMQLAAPLMEQGGGSIINLSSVYGQIAGPMQAAYSASKGAVRLLTKAVAVEFARNGSGIRVNSVHPGPVETDLGFSALAPAVQAGRFPDFESARAHVAAMFPMGRWATTDDIAGAVVFLASDASKFMTGTELVVDGGYSII